MASKENLYFLRSLLLLIEGGIYISKEILSRECQKPNTDLDELLNINKQKLKNSFHGKQYKKLFPDFGKTDINSWDLQLSVGVLIYVFGRNLTLVEKQKLRALRDIRNDTYMHCTTAALDEQKYEEVNEELDDIITTLASTFDISVQQRCSSYIKQFTTGPLDAVRPSLQTLNGLSLSCQKNFKVGVQTELVIAGPSSDWISLCERILETIFNHAESMASEDGDFHEIEEKVQKVLSYLECNKTAVFKGCHKKCIILCFECKDYKSFLNFLQEVECQEYTRILHALSTAFFNYFKPQYPISITCKVTTECLQLVLIDIIKSLSNEEEERRLVVEISSEENIKEKEMEMALHYVKKETKLNNQSSFDVTEDKEAKTSESSYAISSEEDKVISLKDEEKSFLADKVRIMKSVKLLREDGMLEDMMHILSRNGLLTPSDLEQFGITYKRYMDISISMVLTRSKELVKVFQRSLQDQGYGHVKDMIGSYNVSLKDISVLSDLEGSMTGKCFRPNGGKPLIKFTSQQRHLLFKELENPNDIAASLLSMMMISGKEFLEISYQPTRRKSITFLLEILEKCSEKHLVDFCSALEENGYKHGFEEFMRIEQIEQRLPRNLPTKPDILQKYTETDEERGANSVTVPKEVIDGYTSCSETESEDSEYYSLE